MFIRFTTTFTLLLLLLIPCSVNATILKPVSDSIFETELRSIDSGNLNL